MLSRAFDHICMEKVRYKLLIIIILLLFLEQANLHNWLRSCLQKHQKFQASALKEDQKRKVFLYFYTF